MLKFFINKDSEVKACANYESLIENMSAGLAHHKIIFDDSGEPVDYTFLLVNNSFEEMTGLKREQIIGKKITEVLKGISKEKLINIYGQVALTKENISFEQYSANLDRWYKVNAYSQKKDYLTTIFTDITEQKNNEKKLKEQNELFEVVINGISDIIAIQKPDYSIIYYNKMGYEYFNILPEELKEKKCYQILGIDEACKECATRRALQSKKIEENEQYFTEFDLYFNCRSNPVQDENGEIIYIIVHLSNITERKHLEQKLKKLSFHDQLTGLYNRRFFAKEMERLNKSRKIPISILVADIDDMKYINDNYGHQTGDLFIKKTATILNDALRAEDILARIGGDEFSVILPDTDNNTAEKIYERLQNECSNFNKNSSLPEHLSFSIGFDSKTLKNQDLNIIFNNADQMMYENKKG